MIPGYTFFSTKFQNRNGGVGLYVKTHLALVPRSDLNSESDEYETVWCEIENSKDKNILICCTYHHPSIEIENCTEYIQRMLSNPTVSNKHVFILGNFNINLLDYDSHIPTMDFISPFLSQHCLPYIIHPTQVSNPSSTIIYNIFAKVCNLDTKSGNILTQIAGRSFSSGVSC